MLSRNSRKRATHFLTSELFTFMVYLNNEGLFIFQHELLNPSGNSSFCILCQRTHRTDAVFFFDFFCRIKNRRTGKRPVDNLCRRSPRFAFSASDFFAVSRCMGAFREYDRLSVTSGNQEKPLPDRWCAIICSYQLPMLYLIPKSLQLFFPFLERNPLFAFHWLPVSHRSPSLELLHILQNDHSGSDCSCPFQYDPCQPTNIPVYRLASFRL